MEPPPANGSTTSGRVPGASAERFVCGLGKSAAGFEVSGDGGVVPVGEVGDEVEQRLAQPVVVVKQLRKLFALDESL